MPRPQAKMARVVSLPSGSFGPEELDPGCETDGGSAACSLCPFLTLQFVPDIVGPFLDLSRELLQVILGFWVNKCR